MTISVQPQDVRDALDGDQTQYPDEDIAFEIRVAEAIVNDDLAPHSDKTDRLELVGALLAAAFVEEETNVESISVASKDISFSSERSVSLFEQAKMLDPTNKLGTSGGQASYLGVPNVKYR